MEKSTNALFHYIVDDNAFYKIHPAVNINNFKKSSCLVDSKHSSGCATIFDISNKNDITESRALSAAHVVYDTKKDPKFKTADKLDAAYVSFPELYQGMFKHHDKITYIASYETDKICFDKRIPRRDVAVFHSKLKDTPLIFDELKDFKSNINEIKHEKKITGTINHHPLGVLDQRLNVGETDTDGTHLIPTMPASSGSGIHDENNNLSFVHTNGGSGGDKILYNLSILKDYPTEKKIFELGPKNYSVPFSKADLYDFTECFEKKYYH